MKLTRGHYITYLDANWGEGTPSWFKLGKGNTNLAVDLSPDVTTEQDVTDETTTTDNGYKPSGSVDPYYANPEDAIYEQIRNIAMNRLKNDACKTKILEVIVENETDTEHVAWTEDVIVKPTSYGGDTSGFQIPYTFNFNGNRKKGTVEFSTGGYKQGTPTFTAASGSSNL